MVYQQRTELNLIPGREIKHIHVSQRDTQEYSLQFDIYKNNESFKIPSNTTVYIQGTKPDRHAFKYSCDLGGSALPNTVFAPIKYQMTIVPGPVECELSIENTSGNVVGTANFILDVEPAALIDNPDISKSELGDLEEQAKKQIASLERYVTYGYNNIEAAKRLVEQAEAYLPQFDALIDKANQELAKTEGYHNQMVEQYRQAIQYNKSALNYLNQTEEYKNQAEETAKAYSEEAKGYANTAYSYISVSKDWSKMSESWAIGNTGVRDGENTNNSKYWSLMAQSYSQGDTRKRDGEATDNAKYWYQVSKENADKTEEYMNVVETYTNIVIPKFEIDFNTMTLYQTNYTTDSQLQFSLDGNDVLYYELVA